MMVGIEYLFGPSYEIVVVGEKKHKDTTKIIEYLNSIYQPNKLIILKEIHKHKHSIENIAPFIKNYTQIKNQPTIYVCKNQECLLPTTDIEIIKEHLI